MIKVISIDNRMICVRGVGRLFYETGLPIAISIEELRKQNIEVSLLHVVDECLKNGWSTKTTINKIREDFVDSNQPVDLDKITRFCNSTYEEQRDMLYQELFSSKKEAFDVFKQLI